MWNLLIADDERHIREGLKDIIGEMGLPLKIVGVAANGQEVLDKHVNKEINLMILDICMPKLSGLDLIRKLRELEKEDCPLEIIILSGFDEFSYAKEALSLRVSAYLLKPVDENELYDTIKQALARLEQTQKQKEYLFALKKYLGYENTETTTFSDLVTDALHLIEGNFSNAAWDLNAAAQTLNCHPDHLIASLNKKHSILSKTIWLPCVYRHRSTY